MREKHPHRNRSRGQEASTKLLVVDEFLSLREQLGRRRKTVVLTNGCFDLIHLGHVRFLQKAKRLGDILVIGVNSDASVGKLKGKGRPIMSQDARAELLSALACVDYVVIFHELTAEKLVSELKPDVYVKGGDYLDNDLPEANLVRAYGGLVVIVPFVEGYSTSAIIERISRN